MPIVKIEPEQTAQMAQCRQQEIERDFPRLTPENYASEEEYRQALLTSYEGLRNEEYKLIVQNECTKIYNLAMDARAAGISENIGVWNGYRGYVNAPKISKAEKERRKGQVQNCAISRAPEMAGICMYGTPSTVQGKFNSCAITASSLLAEVSAKMGYDGEDNLMVAKYRGKSPGLKNNLVAAQGVSRCDSIPQQYRLTPDSVKQKRSKPAAKPTLNQLIANGTLGAGDAFSIPTGRGARNTSTGYHAMTIASVEKDNNGKIIGYTLQANNAAHLSYHSVNEPSPFGGKQVYNAANTSSWMQDKIKEESRNLQNLSTAELETRVSEAKEKTLSVVTELEQTEAYNARKNYSTRIARRYTASLAQKQALLEQTPVPPSSAPQMTPLPEEKTGGQTPVPSSTGSTPSAAKNEESTPEENKTPRPHTQEQRAALKTELKAQVSDISQLRSPENDARQERMEHRIDAAATKKKLVRADTRTLKQTMRQDAEKTGISDTPAQSSLPAGKNQNTGQTSRSSDLPERNNVRTIPLSQLLKTLNSRNK